MGSTIQRGRGAAANTQEAARPRQLKLSLLRASSTGLARGALILLARSGGVVLTAASAILLSMLSH